MGTEQGKAGGGERLIVPPVSTVPRGTCAARAEHACLSHPRCNSTVLSHRLRAAGAGRVWFPGGGRSQHVRLGAVGTGVWGTMVRCLHHV